MTRQLIIFAALAGLAAVAPALADVQSAVQSVKAIPRVIDAVPDPAGNLWVTVAPDPAVPWSQFAAVVCNVVRPHKARIFLVKMIDSGSVHSKQPKDWRMIGGANCGG
jgi:hypothetical protein